jgi:DNA-binding MarR family transcriptional regulator
MAEGKSLAEELQMSGFWSPYQKVLLNLMFTSARWEARVQELLKGYGLTEQQYNVLRILKGQQGKPLNLYMIQDRMIHRMSNATRIVEKLRQKGLADRLICESNRRQVEVSITERGIHLLDRVTPEMQGLVGQMADNLTEDEAEKLHELLEKVRG